MDTPAVNLQAVNVAAIVLSPLIAVCVTLWYQNRRQRLDVQHQAFLRLMAYRKSIPPNAAMVDTLNVLDVVFSDNQNIVGLWHKYYTLLSLPASEDRGHTWLELLSAIAKHLHYPTLRQTDLDKFYIPQGFVDQLDLAQKMQKEFLRVLQNSQNFGTAKIESEQP